MTGDRVNTCNFAAYSYQYIAWALSKELLLLDPATENAPDMGVDTIDAYANPDLLIGLAQLLLDIEAWGDETGPATCFDKDYSSNNVTAYRMKEGIERFFITDINNPAASAKSQSEMFVMWDDTSAVEAGLFNHVPGGGNVLYMDGHVEFIKYPGETPFSKAWASFVSAFLGGVF